jgi:RNA polymerase sigma factor (sigma-70 family)
MWSFSRNKKPEDTDRIENMRRGDSEAFEQLVRECGRNLYNYSFGLYGNHDDAVDAVQETLLQALRHLDTFHGKTQAQFCSWLREIAKNAYLNKKRPGRRKSGADHSSLDETFDDGSPKYDPADPRAGPDMQVENRNYYGRLLEAIQKELNADSSVAADYQVFIFRYAENMEYRAIAEICGETAQYWTSRWRETIEPAVTRVRLNFAFQGLPSTQWKNSDYRLFSMRIEEGKDYEWVAKVLGRKIDGLRRSWTEQISPLLAKVGFADAVCDRARWTRTDADEMLFHCRTIEGVEFPEVAAVLKNRETSWPMRSESEQQAGIVEEDARLRTLWKDKIVPLIESTIVTLGKSG